MRELVLERLKAYWYDDLEAELDITVDQLDTLSDEDLLNIYDDIVGFQG